jgi:cell division protein FtsB
MKRRSRASDLLRLAGRLGVGALSSLIFVLIAIQFGRIVQENVSMANRLASVNADVAALQSRRRDQLREIKRLADPRGAVPEIHDRLKMVGPNEAIVFIKP